MFSNYDMKVENNKCTNRIFRPWDCSANKNFDDAQDNTITTTTSAEIETKPDQNEKQGFRPIEKQKTDKPPPEQQKQQQPQQNYVVDPFQTNFLPPPPANSDPILLESLMHGYALEEYARVLNQEHQAKILQARKQRPKKYKCPHCHVGFSNNGQLKGHIRIHTGERPFKCNEKDCGKTFTRNEELTRHKRIHSGLRPFPCTQCGKRFGRKDHLKKHSRTHFQPQRMYAVPVMLPYETWATAAASTANYPFLPMYGY